MLSLIGNVITLIALYLLYKENKELKEKNKSLEYEIQKLKSRD